MMKLLKDRFDNGEDLSVKEVGPDIHSVSGIMKQFLRDLPEIIVTPALEEPFIAAGDLQDPNEKLARVRDLVTQLPPPNYAVLRALMDHLRRVESLNKENKMTLRNLGIVFVPTLRIPSAVFTLFISHFESVFTRS